MVAEAYKLSFFDYFKWMAAPATICGLTLYAILYLVFFWKFRPEKKSEEIFEDEIEEIPLKMDQIDQMDPKILKMDQIDPKNSLKNRISAIFGLFVLFSTLAVLMFSSFFHQRLARDTSSGFNYVFA